jgi:hypothetical protein
MEDVKQASPGVLETLMRKIPGYGGYLDREQRRDADRLHREFLAKGTSTLKAKVQDIQEEMLRNGDMSQMSRFGDIGNRLDRITERLRHASYGYTGLFAAAEVNIEELNRIYEFDLSLVNSLQAAEDAVKALDTAVSAKDNAGAKATDLEKNLRDLDSKIDEREKLLKGVV